MRFQTIVNKEGITMRAIIAITVLMFSLLSMTQKTLTQNEPICSEDFIDAQTDLMSNPETYRLLDDNGDPVDSKSQEKFAKQEIETFCDSEQEPLFDGDIDVPIETWILIQNLNPQLAEIAAEFDEVSDCIIGYLYVDHEAGTTADLYGFCEMDDQDNLSLTTQLIEDAEQRIIVRYESMLDTSITALSHEQLTAFELPITPFWLTFYSAPEYDMTRSIRDLDPIRFPGFPDDIQFYLFDNDRPDLDVEIIFGRLEQQLEPPEFFMVELLNQPFSDYGVNVGDQVVVQLTEYEGEMIAVFVGALQQ